MRIDEKKFPALFDNDIVIRRFKEWIPQQGLDMFYDVVNNAKKNLYYTASTIMDHVSQSFEKLIPMKNELPDACRGLLFMMENRPHSMFYLMTTIDDKTFITGQVYAIDEKSHYGDLFAGYFLRSNPKLEFHLYEYIKSNEAVAEETIKIILANELFINYAQVETKEVKPSRQIWDGPTCLYNNKTKFPITVVDSAWYTNLISTGAFKVRGHFRLQPYGHGFAKRKLIWINDFEKDGYTRKAKIQQP